MTLTLTFLLSQIHDLERDMFGFPVHDRLEGDLAQAALGQPPLADQWHLGATGGVGAFHRPRPEVADDGGRRTTVRRERGNGIFVQVPDFLPCPPQHPFTPAAHVVGQ
jgi:hypothetical protein